MINKYISKWKNEVYRGTVMYLKRLNLWNFRKFGKEENNPGLSVEFHNGLNLLVGENDSGKTAIIDAIKYILGTQSNDYQRITEKDFYKQVDRKRTSELKIECTFSDLSPKEAASFLEWLNFNAEDRYELQIRLKAKLVDNRVITDIRAGVDGADIQLDGAARELLRTTYLKPLRDAESELTPGHRSRLAQILKNHRLFQLKEGENHPLVQFVKEANKHINAYFSEELIKINESAVTADDKVITTTGKEISTNLNEYLTEFFPEGELYKAIFTISDVELSDVLKKLSLMIDENTSGLGTLNLLFIATELLLLQNESYNGLKLALIEEIEAHLHPQAQLRLIDFLQKNKTKGQFILTTHSTTLASSIELKNLIIFQENQAFPMGSQHTELADSDYRFLERFLDATKSNLFFARGVILVEGDAENLLLPTIAKIIGKPLHKYGVSIVNVGSTAFLRYSKIFLRKDKQKMKIPVAIITDLDVRPIEYYEEKKLNFEIYCVNNSNIAQLKDLSQDFEFEKIIDNVYESKSSFEDALRTVHKSKRFPNGFKDQCFSIAKFEINKSFIESLRVKKRRSKVESLSKENVQAFISPQWTLEYDFALSSLRKYILKSVLLAKMEKNNEKIELTENIFNITSAEEIEKTEDWKAYKYSDLKIAFEIYKYLLNKQASKTINAQYLAELLNIEMERENISSLLCSDPNINYLVNAIEYVTKGGCN